MNDRSAEEILRFTFSHLDAVLREKRTEKDGVRDKKGGRAVEVGVQEESACPRPWPGQISRAESEGN